MARRGFSGPATMENVQTGDGRVWAPGAWEWDDTALTAGEVVMEWQPEDEGGHLGAVEIGRVTALERRGDAIFATGWVDDEWDHVAEWVRRAEEAGSMGVSAVWDDYEVQLIDTTLDPSETDDGEMVVLAAAGDPDPGAGAGAVLIEEAVGDVLERWTRSRFRKLTSVAMPAFAECRVTLDAAGAEPAPPPIAEEAGVLDAEAALLAPSVNALFLRSTTHSSAGSFASPLPLDCHCGGHGGAIANHNGMTVVTPPTCSCGPGLVAAGAPAIPAFPPRSWFDYDPALFAAYRSQAEGDEFGTVRITAAGETYGYIAAWGVCHTGYSGDCVLTPRSAANYGHFRTGYVVCDDDTEARTGPLTIGGGHADLTLSYAGAIEHYDDVCAAFADVACGEDDFGVWFHGALRPDVSAETIRAARASALSGDWRPVGSTLEMVAALAVNSPGFPVPRARVASGRLMALVSAGSAGVAVMRSHEQAAAAILTTGFAGRLAVLEQTVAKSARTRLLSGARERALERLLG